MLMGLLFFFFWREIIAKKSFGIESQIECLRKFVEFANGCLRFIRIRIRNGLRLDKKIKKIIWPKKSRLRSLPLPRRHDRPEGSR